MPKHLLSKCKTLKPIVIHTILKLLYYCQIYGNRQDRYICVTNLQSMISDHLYFVKLLNSANIKILNDNLKKSILQLRISFCETIVLQFNENSKFSKN